MPKHYMKTGTVKYAGKPTEYAGRMSTRKVRRPTKRKVGRSYGRM